MIFTLSDLVKVIPEIDLEISTDIASCELSMWLDLVSVKAMKSQYKSSKKSNSEYLCYECTCCSRVSINKSSRCWRVTGYEPHSLQCENNGIVSGKIISFIVGEQNMLSMKYDAIINILNRGGIITSKSTRSAIKHQKKLIRKTAGLSFKEDFAMLNSYLEGLDNANPGSIITCQWDENNNFVRLFVMLNAQCNIAECCHPVISLDACHLVGLCWGNYHVMVVTSSNGLHKDVTLAYAIVPAEDEINYKFLIDGMKANPKMKQFLEQTTLVVFSDRGRAIVSAITNYLPNAMRRACNVREKQLTERREKQSYLQIDYTN